MKYRDVITFFIALALLLTFVYTVGVDKNVWFAPLILFIVFIIVVYKLWIEDWEKQCLSQNLNKFLY